MATKSASPHSGRSLPQLLIVFAGLVGAACGGSFRAPSAPSAVTAPTPQAVADRPALAIHQSPGFAACLRNPQPSCLQPLSLARALDGPGPTNLVATVNGATVTLTWSGPAGVSVLDYIIDVRSAPGLPPLINVSSEGRTSYTATDAPTGTYYISVRAQTPDGFTNPSNEVTVVVTSGAPTPGPGPTPAPCTAAPGAPSGLRASVSGDTITLSWTAPSGSPTGYLVDAGSAPGLSDFASGRAVGSDTTISAPGQPAGTYYLRIRATNGCGTGPASNEVSVTVAGGAPGPPPGTCTTAPGAPSGLSATSAVSANGVGFTVTLSWTAPSGLPAGYLLDAGSGPGLSDITSGREIGVETTMSAPNQPGGTYYLRVRATNNCGTSPASNEVSLAVGGMSGPPGSGCSIAPGAPSDLRATAAGSTITLSWTAPSYGGSPTSYLLDAGSAPGLSDIASGREVGVETTMSAPNQPGGTYYVRVRAANNCGTSPASNEVSVTVGGGTPTPGPGPTPGPPGPPPGTCTTAPGAPSSLGASVSGSTITLRWTAPSGSPESYLMDVGSAPGLSDIASGREVGVETTMSAPNQPAGTYYLRIRAKNSCGTGPASNEVSVTVAGAAAQKEGSR